MDAVKNKFRWGSPTEGGGEICWCGGQEEREDKRGLWILYSTLCQDAATPSKGCCQRCPTTGYHSRHKNIIIYAIEKTAHDADHTRGYNG
jgi:hypothetical protein